MSANGYQRRSAAIPSKAYLTASCCWVCCQSVQVALQTCSSLLDECTCHATGLNDVLVRPGRQEAAESSTPAHPCSLAGVLHGLLLSIISLHHPTCVTGYFFTLRPELLGTV